MATVTGYTAARMKEIEDAAIVDGSILGDDLILTRFDGTTINAGDVRGPQGPTGSTGDTAILVVTSSTRPELPFAGSVIYETDTDRFYKYDGSDWVYIGGVIICTSSTRPASPFDGLEIYETDTKRPYTYNGTDWVYTGGDFICTSSTRPASPFDGLPIYETDTKLHYFWNGTTWVNPNAVMRCKVYRTSVQAIGNIVVSAIVWTTQDYDTDNIWSPGGTADSFIIPVNGDGSWRFSFNANFGVNANGVRVLGITKNGAMMATFNSIGNSIWLVGGCVTTDFTVVAGDVIKCIAYHSAGAVINIDVSYPISFSAQKIG